MHASYLEAIMTSDSIIKYERLIALNKVFPQDLQGLCTEQYELEYL